MLRPDSHVEKICLARVGRIISVLVLLWISTSAAIAGEVRVFAAVAVQDPLERLAAAFTEATGNKVDIRFALTDPILADIKAGKPVDVVVLPEAGRTRLEEAGLSISQTPVSVSLAGVGVPISAASPDISSLDKFTALLHQVPSISYTDPKIIPTAAHCQLAIPRLSNVGSLLRGIRSATGH